MTGQSPFDQRPDPELGRQLRAALEAGNETAFIRRVLDDVRNTSVDTWWTILGAWARPGLAAALLLAALGGFALGRMAIGPALTTAAAVDEPLRGATTDAVALLSAPRPPDIDVVLAATTQTVMPVPRGPGRP